MRDESEVWHALLRRKGLSVTDLAARLGVTRQHAHHLLTGLCPGETQRDELEAALALGTPAGERPLYGVGELDDSGELELVPAGEGQPLFAHRELATRVAKALSARSEWICIVPLWPGYAWASLVAFHAAWGVEPEPRKVFVVEEAGADDGVAIEAVVDEIKAGLEATLEFRARAREPASLDEVASRLGRYTEGRLPQ